MSDEFDRASEIEDKDRERCIDAARANIRPIPEVDECLWCGEETHGKRWCDTDCRDMWEKFHK